MTDKEKIIAFLEGMSKGCCPNETKEIIINKIIPWINSLPEEPVSKDLNIESMIESYEQRLISQANGVKNSPLVGMCLASYKHGINETLDTLKLSNLVRTVKNRKESKFRVGDRIKFKGVRNEDVTRVITNIQKCDGGVFRYLFADGSIYSIGDDGIELVEEPVSEDLEEAAEAWSNNDDNTGSCDYIGVTVCEYAFKAGAKWQKEQINKVLLSEVLPCFMHGGDADEVVAKLDEVLDYKEVKV